MKRTPSSQQYVSLRGLFFRPWQSFVILICFFFNSLGSIPTVQAQEFKLPAPGKMVHLSPNFNPPMLKGIKVHPENPFKFDFILDQGDKDNRHPERSEGSHQEQLKSEATRLIKYFLASLTVPEKDLWVNLSPYEKNRIIPQSFGLTEMGRDLLAEDYMLKQITASLIYPEDQIGKKFWKSIYQEAAKRYHTTNIPINTFNKVWIVPDKAVVYENVKNTTAYVVESKLKVMLEQDYLSLESNTSFPNVFVGNLDSRRTPVSVGQYDQKHSGVTDTSTLGSQILREIIIPELTKEVNQGQNFAQLRQVYNSLILATWYKNKIKDSILEQVYADKNKVKGLSYSNEKNLSSPNKINMSSPNVSVGDPEHIYQQYLRAFKKGVYNYIKEDFDPTTQETIPRKYFSGGMKMDLEPGKAMVVVHNFHVSSDPAQSSRSLVIKMQADPIVSHAMASAIPPHQANLIPWDVLPANIPIVNKRDDTEIPLVLYPVARPLPKDQWRGLEPLTHKEYIRLKYLILKLTSRRKNMPAATYSAKKLAQFKLYTPNDRPARNIEPLYGNNHVIEKLFDAAIKRENQRPRRLLFPEDAVFQKVLIHHDIPPVSLGFIGANGINLKTSGDAESVLIRRNGDQLNVHHHTVGDGVIISRLSLYYPVELPGGFSIMASNADEIFVRGTNIEPVTLGRQIEREAQPEESNTAMKANSVISENVNKAMNTPEEASFVEHQGIVTEIKSKDGQVIFQTDETGENVLVWPQDLKDGPDNARVFRNADGRLVGLISNFDARLTIISSRNNELDFVKYDDEGINFGEDIYGGKGNLSNMPIYGMALIRPLWPFLGDAIKYELGNHFSDNRLDPRRAYRHTRFQTKDNRFSSLDDMVAGLNLPNGAKIHDTAAGTGIISLRLAQRLADKNVHMRFSDKSFQFRLVRDGREFALFNKEGHFLTIIGKLSNDLLKFQKLYNQGKYLTFDATDVRTEEYMKGHPNQMDRQEIDLMEDIQDDEQYDFVRNMNMVNYLTPKDAEVLVKQLGRTVKDGGYLLVGKYMQKECFVLWQRQGSLLIPLSEAHEHPFKHPESQDVPRGVISLINSSYRMPIDYDVLKMKIDQLIDKNTEDKGFIKKLRSMKRRLIMLFEDQEFDPDIHQLEYLQKLRLEILHAFPPDSSIVLMFKNIMIQHEEALHEGDAKDLLNRSFNSEESWAKAISSAMRASSALASPAHMPLGLISEIRAPKPRGYYKAEIIFLKEVEIRKNLRLVNTPKALHAKGTKDYDPAFYRAAGKYGFRLPGQYKVYRPPYNAKLEEVISKMKNGRVSGINRLDKAPLPQNGGIDFTPARMKVQTKIGSLTRDFGRINRRSQLLENDKGMVGQDGGIKFHLSPAMLAQLKDAAGFEPRITSVEKLKSLSDFLGN